MKLISSEANKHGERYVCEDAVFDPYLTKLISVDKDELMVLLKYDALENGRPLGITLLPAEAELIVKLTPTGCADFRSWRRCRQRISLRGIWQRAGKH